MPAMREPAAASIPALVFLIAIAAAVARADDSALAPSQPPTSLPATQAISRHDDAVNAARQAYYRAISDADRKEIDDLDTALKAAMSAFDLDEANRIKAARTLAEQLLKQDSSADKSADVGEAATVSNPGQSREFHSVAELLGLIPPSTWPVGATFTGAMRIPANAYLAEALGQRAALQFVVTRMEIAGGGNRYEGMLYVHGDAAAVRGVAARMSIYFSDKQKSEVRSFVACDTVSLSGVIIRCDFDNDGTFYVDLFDPRNVTAVPGVRP
jgi:hypothetical protein